MNLQVAPYNIDTFAEGVSRDQAQEFKNEKPLIKTQWILRGDISHNITYLKHDFRMSRRIESEDLKKIVRLILESKAHELFEKKAPLYKVQPNSQIIGNGYHQFRNLKECACHVLNRVTKPGIRAEYEKQVLDKILALSQVMTEIPISIFAPGTLFGEFVLLVKILNLLEEKKWNGELKLFFIDTIYTSGQAYKLWELQKKTGEGNNDQISAKNNKTVKIAIDIKNISMKQLEHDKASKAIQSFFDLLQKITPPSIKIKSFFFENTEHYIKLAEQKPKFKNVLQLGSDIDDNRLTVIDLVNKTQSINGMGMVVLVPRPVFKDDIQQLTSDGQNKVQPMIFYKKTQADEVEYIWLNERDIDKNMPLVMTHQIVR